MFHTENDLAVDITIFMYTCAILSKKNYETKLLNTTVNTKLLNTTDETTAFTNAVVSSVVFNKV